MRPLRSEKNVLVDIRIPTARSGTEAFRAARIRLGIGLLEVDHGYGAQMLDAEKTCWRMKITTGAMERLRKGDEAEVIGFQAVTAGPATPAKPKGPGL